MGYLCGSTVVKLKTYQMTINGREIMNIATREQTRHKWRKIYAAEMLMSKSEAVISMVT